MSISRVWALPGVHDSRPLIVPPPGPTQVMDMTVPQANANSTNYNIRSSYINSGFVSFSGTQVRFKFEAPASGTHGGKVVIQSCYCGIPQNLFGNANYIAAATRITSGGGSGIEITQGQTKWSDWINFAFEWGTSNFMISQWYSNINYIARPLSTPAASRTWRRVLAVNQAGNQTVSGYSNFSSWVWSLTEIEAQ